MRTYYLSYITYKLHYTKYLTSTLVTSVNAYEPKIVIKKF